ncbi:hypothetical protein [Duganella sp. BJB1802]|uniref:hypothetical protein n=1 Tax=Duganella sp. BJB1802 TaxID=2744575 RepID=UPI001E58391F|nr:hypothetical protein [Duganella sp. BJB1802]
MPFIVREDFRLQRRPVFGLGRQGGQVHGQEQLELRTGDDGFAKIDATLRTPALRVSADEEALRALHARWWKACGVPPGGLQGRRDAGVDRRSGPRRTILYALELWTQHSTGAETLRTGATAGTAPAGNI